jgi:8-oxo-dGTP diphosphatase
MMLDSLPRIRVVAAVIEEDGRYLITQRRANAVLGGLWEFPSGRVEEGESDQTALARELRERLGVDVEVGKIKARRTHRYEGYAVELTLFQTQIAPGSTPKPLRVAEVQWVKAEELENYPFPPADQKTTDLLLGIHREPPSRARRLAPALAM